MEGYYILALSEEQAQRIWNTWIDNLEIVAADGRPKMYKFEITYKIEEIKNYFLESSDDYIQNIHFLVSLKT